MDGWWDVKELDQFFYRITKNLHNIKIFNFKFVLQLITSFLINSQNKTKSKDVAEQHYDLGNEFYHAMLDPKYMQYTCGYWKNAKNLQEAQINKLDLVCRKLHLPKHGTKVKDKILELGSGFGGFANFATRNYNCEVVSYNISKEQVSYAKNLNKNLPVEIIESDYRDSTNEKNKNRFDKVVSIGMIEHVGPGNYKLFMNVACHSLKDNGILFIHTIGRKDSARPGQADPWIRKYIFPGGQLPSAAQIAKAAEKYFRLEDLENFGHYYDPTLMTWFRNFDKNWPKFKDQYGERFYRMWKYYLLSCAGAFRSGSISLFQFVFVKGNPDKIYEVVR
jgi:cyclopropane-fatty-acyl-phospholipid synthase